MGSHRAGFHPFVLFLFFAYAVLVAALFQHPVMLACAFVCALAYSVELRGAGALRFALRFVLPLMALSAGVNVAFNHQGVTILTYFRDNPITLESIIYGCAAAVMIGTVLLWFACYNAVMTSDKFMYLFGRIVPAMSLIVSMALAFVPRYVAQAKRVAAARRGIGFDVASGGWLVRMKNGSRILSVMVTWSLENAIETSDSMLARGYGLPGRTAYSNERFDGRDRAALIALAALIAAVLAGIGLGAVSIRYFPSFLMDGHAADALFGLHAAGGGLGAIDLAAPAIVIVCHAAACALLLAIDLRERWVFHTLRARVGKEAA